jgi:invasion protein IalB
MTTTFVKSMLAIVLFAAASLLLAGSEQSINAKASDKANEVAHDANTNQDYMKNCKSDHTAKECATGPDNNGEFTSNSAHDNNGP